MRVIIAIAFVLAVAVQQPGQTPTPTPTPTVTFDKLYPATPIALPPLPPTLLPPHGAKRASFSVYVPLVHGPAIDALTSRRPVD